MNNETDQILPEPLSAAQADYAALRYPGPTPDFHSAPNLSPALQPAPARLNWGRRFAPPLALAASVVVLLAVVGLRPDSTEPATEQMVWSPQPRAAVRLVGAPRGEKLRLPARPKVAFPERPVAPPAPYRPSGFAVASDELG